MKRQTITMEVLLGALAASILLLILLRPGRFEPPPMPSDPGAARVGVPVLAYHYLREGGVPERIARSVGTVLLNLPLIPANDYWTVSRATFERHLRYLKDNGYHTITLEELAAYMRGDTTLPGKSVAITFDDGDRSVYRIAYPLLKRYGMVGAVFVVTGHVGESWNGLALSSWNELKLMKNSGVLEIGSHTHDLHYKTKNGRTPYPYFAVIDRGAGRAERESVLADFRRSLLEVEEMTGEQRVFLAWPFGFGSELADSLAREAGYHGIMTLRAGVNKAGDSPYGIKRYTITSQTSLRSFEMMVPPGTP